jgi:hypothetical protein
VVSASEPPELPQEPPEVVYRRPAWVEPPADLVPGIVPVELILARTPQRAIGLSGIRAYPTGFGCTLHLRLREDIPGEQSNFGVFNMFGDGVDPAGEFADYYLRFGVGFADGRKATNLVQRHDFDEGPAPDPPTLWLVRWEGYDRLAWEVDVWVYGLPPPGPLAFVCRWPAGGVAASGVEIDAGWCWRPPTEPPPSGRRATEAAGGPGARAVAGPHWHRRARREKEAICDLDRRSPADPGRRGRGGGQDRRPRP